MTEYRKPLPKPSLESLPFWDGCRRHELLLSRCNNCGSHWFPPSIICPECLSEDWDWAASSGRGTVFGYGIYRRLYNKAFEEEMPYVVAVIQLEEGPRIESNIINCPVENVTIDMPVKVTFEDVAEDYTLYKFEPASD